MSSSWDEAWGIVAVLIGIGILLLLGILVAIAYYFLLWLTWQGYRRMAADAYDQVLLEHTGGFEADDVAHTLFGVRPQAHGSHHMAEILFGVEVDRQ